MAPVIKCLLIFLCYNLINADEIDRTARKGGVIKLLREMVNQTKADTLNLPANATSIRENITDTFSCENRTYGYYADVDNDCQVFHVCLTSQTSSGRNVTYRWSFICPNETIFNQEVLTCARPRDSIDCADSPMFYYMNDNIGKVPDDEEKTEGQNTEGQKEGQMIQGQQSSSIRNKDRRRQPIKKQNMIVEKLMTEVKKENLLAEDIEEDYVPVIEVEMTPEVFMESEKIEEVKEDKEVSIKKEVKTEKKRMSAGKQKPIIHEIGQEYEMKGGRMENARLSAERSLRRGKMMSRGSFRFKANSLRNNL